MMISAAALFSMGLFLLVLESTVGFTVSSFNSLSILPFFQTRNHQYSATSLYYRDDKQGKAGAEAESQASCACKEQLLKLLIQVPSNAPTPGKLTRDILNKVEELETLCPTPEDEVLGKLAGVWELQWTAQDRGSDEWRNNPLRAYINPFENQSYSNNPDGGGRANPFLPRRVQDRLERLGILRSIAETRSSQSIDLTKQRARNVVAFEIPTLLRTAPKASLTVDINFTSNPTDKRRVDVKFDKVRLVIPTRRVDINLPLGPVGPMGWLRTGYIDDTMRITRGHKGSVFILTRPVVKRRAEV